MPSSEQSELLATPWYHSRSLNASTERFFAQAPPSEVDDDVGQVGYLFFFHHLDCFNVLSSFNKDQRWLKPPRRLIFIDESRDLANGSTSRDISLYDIQVDEIRFRDHSSSSASVTPPASSHSRPHDEARDQSVTVRGQHPPRHRGAFENGRVSVAPEVHVRREPRVTKSVEPYDMRDRSSPYNPPPRNTLSESYPNVPNLPLKNRTEAILFRHYIQKLAICLDLCDPLRHFELVVPERAGGSHTLLNAIFAIAARHLSHTTDFDPLASNRYHDECLKYLIPMLDHTSTVSDENMFAATIILRMLEEMDVPTTGQDNYSHLLGIHAFVNVGDHHMVPGSLSAASFWVGLRQEIYIAVITQQPVKLSLDHYVVDRSFSPTDDYTWSNRAIVLLADVLNFCFGGNPSTPSHWTALDEATIRWSTSRPPSFNPFFYRERTNSLAFPEVWHGSSCHVIGIQHHILAQLFLIQFDPSIPKVGTNRRAAHRIENLVRELCGIGVCNQWTPPAMFTACMGIAMFGDQFGERSDQEALLDILRRTEADHARPTAAIQHQLLKAWGWVPEDDE
ncbi:hypothetical protein GGR53DRAFT_533083 [Hypoxylon sp. FL1150]|nr:hypothetical protein GGR53DRAFT_533083 [Hypoxylon sp. FL1150]